MKEIQLPAGHPDELTPRRPVRGADSGCGQRRLVLVTNQDQQWAPYLGGVPARPVEHKAKGRTGGDLLPPVRIPAIRVERPAAVPPVRRSEQRDGSRLAGERHQPRRPPGQRAGGVGDTQGGEAEHGERLLMPRRVA